MKILKITVAERSLLQEQLAQFSFIQKIYPSDANFILIKTDNADELYQYLSAKKIIVRNRSKEPLCENCIRVTVGTPDENEILIETLKKYRNA